MAERQLAERQLIYERKAKSSSGARPGFFWALFLLTGLLFGVSVAYATDSQTARHWRNLSIAGTLATSVGLVVLYHRMRTHDALQWYEVEYAPVAPPAGPAAFPDDKREIAIRTVRGEATLIQPRPGAFSNWLKDVINPDTRITFSRNEAKRREWADWQYINLVAQLKSIGWLHPARLLNGAPDIDATYLNEMKEWLNTPVM